MVVRIWAGPSVTSGSVPWGGLRIGGRVKQLSVYAVVAVGIQ